MRKLLWLSAAAVGLLGTANFAAAQQKPTPGLELRVRSVNDLLAKAEYLGGLAGQAEAAKQAAAVVQAMTDKQKGLEGIDPSRPFGLYASLTKDVIDSPVVLMVPVSDEEAALNLLTNRLSLNPKKGDDGTYELNLPNVPVPFFFRFAHKTLYATAQTPKGIEPDRLIEPKDFFQGQDEAVASLKLHVDRLPEDVKKTIVGQFELKVHDAKDRTEPGETPAQRKLRQWSLDRATELLHTVLSDGQELSARLLVVPKSDDLTLEVNFGAKEGSDLAKAFANLGRQTAKAATLAGAKSPVAAVGLRYTLPEKARKELEPVIDALIAEQLEKTSDNDRQPAKLVFDALAPTWKSGELDAGLVVTEADGKLQLLGAIRVAEGAGIEKTIKQFAPFAPEDKAKFVFDVKKVGGLTLHTVTEQTNQLKSAFGTDTLVLGTSNDLLAVSADSTGKALEAAPLAEGKSVPGPIVAEFSVARIFAATNKSLPPDRIKQMVSDAFPEGSEGKDTATLTLTGGDALKLRLSIKGQAAKLLSQVGQATKN